MNDREACPETRNWYLSDEYCEQSKNPNVEMRLKADGRTGLFALKRLPRKYVICYYPVVIRRKNSISELESSYRVDVITKRQIPSSTFVGVIPNNECKDSIGPMWRGKPTIGHYVSISDGDVSCNAERLQLRFSPISEGEIFCLPISALRSIEKDSEIIL